MEHEIRLVSISSACFESYPCQHPVVIDDGYVRIKTSMGGAEILNLLKKAPDELKEKWLEHFEVYGNKTRFHVKEETLTRSANKGMIAWFWSWFC